MTQENKDLLLKDLCMRFPYFTKVQINNEIVVLNSICDDDGYHFNFIGDNREGINIENIKPYLFPFSSMTEEQKKEFLSTAGYEIREEDCGRHTETYYYDMVGHERDFYPNTEAVDWCRKNHFDIYGLIPMDLAIDATNKNIY